MFLIRCKFLKPAVLLHESLKEMLIELQQQKYELNSPTLRSASLVPYPLKFQIPGPISLRMTFIRSSFLLTARAYIFIHFLLAASSATALESSCLSPVNASV
ncbi:hypothetical protein BDZ91DRAFT_221185 [Kalaharituber pfeilii]|nr:hypothetical protein BDZ91DRAFT_221185 [Kalaharituber pfeilii]